MLSATFVPRGPPPLHGHLGTRHPLYMHGDATNSEVGVYAYAPAQVKKTMEMTHYSSGENSVFWGGRKGHQTLLNTDMEHDLDGALVSIQMIWLLAGILVYEAGSLVVPGGGPYDEPESS